jgi:hypothetical protein
MRAGSAAPAPRNSDTAAFVEADKAMAAPAAPPRWRTLARAASGIDAAVFPGATGFLLIPRAWGRELTSAAGGGKSWRKGRK